MDKYYVYAHCRIGDNSDKPFYIGKGSGNRFKHTNGRSSFWKKVVAKYGYYYYIIKENLSEDDAFALEIETIYKYKCIGRCECNMTLGGDGVRVIKRWWYSEEWRQKVIVHLQNRETGKDNKSYKDVISKEELYDLYVIKKMSSTEIGKIKNISYATITSRLKEYNIQARTPGRQSLSIICINDGNIFKSINDAAKYYNVFRENIKKVLKGKYKHTNQLNFKYYEESTKISI